MIRSTSHELGFKAANHTCSVQYRIARIAFAEDMSSIATYAHPLLQLLAEVFETRLYASDPLYHSTDYQHSLDNLKSRLNDVDLVTRVLLPGVHQTSRPYIPRARFPELLGPINTARPLEGICTMHTRQIGHASTIFRHVRCRLRGSHRRRAVGHA